MIFYNSNPRINSWTMFISFSLSFGEGRGEVLEEFQSSPKKMAALARQPLEYILK
jgi:4-diphosphocytidyl-2C-methyl-D-erythritol kinase